MNIRKIVDLESVQKSISTIQAKIDSLVACQQALRGVHNALIPISRLPREVLSHIIFNLVVHSPPSQTYRTRPRPYLVLTQVCHDWRRLAIDNPALWIRPDFPRATLCSMMLERAGNMPLAMEFTHLRGDLICQHADKLPRVKELTLHVDDSGLPEPIHLATSMPHLKILDVQCLYRVATLPSEFLDNVHKSRLKHLTLYNCMIPWTSACLTGLTSLSFSLNYGHPDKIMVHSDLLQILRQNPGLVDLRLRNIMSSQEKFLDAPSQSKLVVLRRLESLSIGGAIHDSALSRLLVSIQAPRLSAIELPEITTDTDSDYTDLIICANKFLKNIDSSMQVRSASIISNTTGSFADDGDPMVSLLIALSCVRICAQEPFDLRLSFRPGLAIRGSDVQFVTTAVLDDLPMDNLNDLTIHNTGSAAEDVHLDVVWKAVSFLPELTSFSIKHGNSLGVDSDLLKLIAPEDSSGPFLHFPALRTFSWESSWFNPFRKTYWKKVLVPFVEATRSRAMLSEATPGEFKLHQEWHSLKGRASTKEAKIRVYGSEVTGEFERMCFPSLLIGPVLTMLLKTSMMQTMGWMAF